MSQSAGPARRAAYDAKWATLEGLAAAATITYAHIPFINDANGAAAPPDALRALVLFGVKGGPAGVRSRLRSEVLRWHPDKFEARWGSRLAAGDRDRILARVKEVAQQLTEMMTQRGG